MAGTLGSSMAENERSCDSQIGIKRIKSGDEEEDRFSALPDFLIHRILSFLPATDLVTTLVLSKWWKHQWTRVPALKFVPLHGMSADKFYNFVEKTLNLHDCPNIDKFVVKLKSLRTDDYPPDLNSWIQFAVGRNVKELTVNFNEDHHVKLYELPQFLFSNSALVKLKLSTCNFVHIEDVNWGSLKILRLYQCEVQDEKIENVLSGSPLLEYLELHDCNKFSKLDIASKSLKTLILDGVSCFCEEEVGISCPNLERLRISGLVWFTSLKLMNLPSSVYATLDFYFDEMYLDLEVEDETSVHDCINLVKQTLGQVEHVEKLEIGRWLIEVLSSSKVGGDCIGYLTDSIIERIIFFFPSIKEGFESDLYNMWQHTWTDVPVFDFVSNEKFFVDSKDIPLMLLDPRLSLWILYAIRNNVQELILDCDATSVELGQEYVLPQFLFNNSSFVKMKICASEFIPKGKVNWQSLKSLELEHCELGKKTIKKVLSGSPLLECIELHSCGFRETMVIVSEHLKTCVIDEFGECPALIISCPNLESLRIRVNLSSTRLKLVNLPSSLHATLDLYVLKSDDISPDDSVNLVKEIREQILHVEQLNIRFEEVDE